MVANAIIYLTKILWVVTVHGYLEESDVKSTCGGLRLIVQNLTRCTKVDLKSDKTKTF